ncbi:MAG TPA: transglycosylase domain-containing protein [Acidimicrobiales bacterium]|nr:transglycosylase domain-containing protein [Acidimicrobiales bacterium]
MNYRLLSKIAATIAVAGAVMASSVVALAVPISWLGDTGEGKPAPILLSTLEQRSYVYGADGSLIANLRGEFNRQPVRLDQIPKHVVDAILAVEDSGFWSHDGVDGRGLLRAFKVNLDKGAVSQGGSTITQQLVKLSVLTSEKTLDRKVQEIVLARRLERQMTKEQILARYLNTVYFGNHAYGIQAASETYFGIGAGDLNKGQAALLAGMIRNPIATNPVKYPDKAKERRHTALTRMVDQGVVTEEEMAFIDAAPLPTELHNVLPPPDDYFVEEVKQQLLDDERLGATPAEREKAIFQGGLRIYTTFDPRAQHLALQARNEQLPGTNGVFDIVDPRNGETRQATAAIVTVDNATGAVRAMVGGPGFDNYKYNIATQSPGRQGGSSFKTFVLASLMEQGYSPNDIVDGTAPCSFNNPAGEPNPYVVDRSGEGSGGVDTITHMTTSSINCAYIRLGQIAGLQNVSDVANRLGIPNVDPSNLSTPLGTKEVTPMQMAAAYAAIANEGTYNRPYLIDRVEDNSGRVVIQHNPTPQAALDPNAARLVTHVLEQNVQGGTGTRARISGRPAAGKTGTAQNHADVWFVGYTAQLTTAVWIGGMGGQVPIRVNGAGIFGGTYPAAVWGAYMGAYTEGMPVAAFASPDGIGAGKFIQADPGVDLNQHGPPPPPGGDENAGTVPPGPGGGDPPDPRPGGGGGGGGGGGQGPGQPTIPGIPIVPGTDPPPTDPQRTEPPATAPQPAAVADERAPTPAADFSTNVVEVPVSAPSPEPWDEPEPDFAEPDWGDG